VISIIIPTYNNLKYLKLCLYSINKNSSFTHDIIVHINEGTDGTLDFVKSNEIKYTYSELNSGLCVGCNSAAKISKYDLLFYAHDDMYFCPNWDKVLVEEVNNINTKMFYLSGICINADPRSIGHLNFSAGDNVENFNEKKLLENYNNLNHFDFQGSTWSPHLIHKDLWNKVGGFSEEFSPGAGSDPDLNMKLWKEGVRIFKGLSKSKFYHFGSVTLRKNANIFKNKVGSKSNKIFLLKWGISIKFFKKYYLRSDTKYFGILSEPRKNLHYYIDLIKNKATLFYNLIFK
tara:strand:+ start:176 stop:1042 length:867 start_codon:yes stop_codon:yes gene_type:complete